MTDGRFGGVVDVRSLLAPERAALLDLLGDLDADAWTTATPCPAWSVHGLAVHLIHDDLRRLSGERDGHTGAWIDASTLDELVDGLDRINQAWVATVAPSFSPRLVVEWLGWLAVPTEEHLIGLDPDALDGAVAWAGSGRHPNWLDVAREYTERWIHQQQLREAVRRPGLEDETYVAPVVETFARGLPAALPDADPGAEVVVSVAGPFERSWLLRATSTGWKLVAPTETASEPPAATVELPVGVFWRRAVRMIDRATVQRAARWQGDERLAEAVLDLRAAIVPDEPADAPVAPSGNAVVVTPHRPEWAERGAASTAWLEGLDVPGFVRVDHIGSTAIPGMAAKDRIDLQMSVTDLDEAATALDRELPLHGFLRSPYERDHVPAGLPDDPARWAKRLWLRPGPADGVNLHVRLAGSPGERLALLFRDWFRAHPDAVPAYAAFKRALVAHIDDIGAYSDVKDPIVDLVIVTAERWATEVGWAP